MAHVAVKNGDLDQLKTFGDVSQILNDQAETAMHTAVLYGQIEILKYLLNRYPQMAKTQNRHGQTALHHAVLMRDVSMVQVLVSCFIDLIDICDNQSQTPLQSALRTGNWQAAAVMIAHKPNSIERSKIVNDRLLHHAIESNDTITVKFMLTFCKPELFVPRRSRTPLHRAVVRRSSCDIVKLILNANPHAIDIPDDFGRLPIIDVADGAIVRYMLDICPHVIHHKDLDFHLNLLHIACLACQQWGNDVFAKILQLCPALLHEVTKTGESVLHLAFANYHRLNVNTILRFEPDLVDTDKNGNTVLHIALHAACDLDVILAVFQQCPSNLSCSNLYGDTPLKLAVKLDRRDVMKMFQPHITIDAAIAVDEMCRNICNIDLQAYVVQQCTVLDAYLLPDITHIVLD